MINNSDRSGDWQADKRSRQVNLSDGSSAIHSVVIHSATAAIYHVIRKQMTSRQSASS